MQWSLWIFSWSIQFLNGSGILILRLLRIPATGHRHVHSPEEDGAPGNLVGVLHTKDVVTAFVGMGQATTATLLRPVIRVPGDMPRIGSSPTLGSAARIRRWWPPTTDRSKASGLTAT